MSGLFLLMIRQYMNVHKFFCFMTRKEYELIYSAFRSYRTYMLPDEEVLAEKILDDIFYPHFDKLAGVEDV